jgi:bacteriorhodopsin
MIFYTIRLVMLGSTETLMFTTFNFALYLLIINLIVSFIFAFVHPEFRVVFGIEVLISLVASIVYYLIIKISKSAPDLKSIDWKTVTTLRYIDWSITTPLLLVSFSLFLSNGEKVKDLANFIMTLIFFDLIMILAGYLGTVNVLTTFWSLVIGFLAYFIIFYLIYQKFFQGTKVTNHSMFKKIMFVAIVILWFIYGAVYNTSIYTRNITTNVLDGIAKGVFGLSLGSYLLLHK